MRYVEAGSGPIVSAQAAAPKRSGKKSKARAIEPSRRPFGPVIGKFVVA